MNEIIQKLQEGNRRYLSAVCGEGDISPAIRKETCENGQHPYAVIVTCSDSRVIPESIFSAGIGELFVIRVAGNVIDDHQMGSIEYAVSHLDCRQIVVMGHTHCGAVDAAICHDPEGYIRTITEEIKAAIGEEKDSEKACRLNVRHSMKRITDSLMKHLPKETFTWEVAGAVYHIEDGHVEFFAESVQEGRTE